jgi:4'-phosphopantetheinyl transferase
MTFFLRDAPIPKWENVNATEIELKGIHVWKTWLQDRAGDEKKYYSWLSEGEKGRAHRLRPEPVKARFINAHGVVREILGRYLHQPAEKIEFDATLSGKPILSGESAIIDPGLYFNLSHSEDLLVLAVSQGFELGIDVERIKAEIDHTAISGHFFAPEEMDWLRSLAPENQVEAFYRIWTCKEAVLKADGSGLRQRLDAVKIEFPSVNNTTGGWQAVSIAGSKKWTVQIFKAEPEYAAALAFSLDASAAILPEIRYYQRTG